MDHSAETSVDPSLPSDETCRCVLFCEEEEIKKDASQSNSSATSVFLSATRSILEEIDHIQVMVAPNLEELASLLNDDVMSLVLIDLHHDAALQSGIAVLKELKEGDLVPAEYIPACIAITPRGHREARNQACALGASDCVSYPYRNPVAKNRFQAQLSAHNVQLMRRQIDLWRTRCTLAKWKLQQLQSSSTLTTSGKVTRSGGKNASQQAVRNYHRRRNSRISKEEARRRASDAFVSHPLSTSPSLLPVNHPNSGKIQPKSATSSPTSERGFSPTGTRRPSDATSTNTKLVNSRRGSFVLLPAPTSDLEARFADLRSHRRDSLEFELALKHMTDEMRQLKSQISQSFESPMQHVLQLLAQLPQARITNAENVATTIDAVRKSYSSVEQIATGNGDREDQISQAVAKTLPRVIVDLYDALKKANIYEPDFDQLAERSGIDPETKEWLLREYSSSGRVQHVSKSRSFSRNNRRRSVSAESPSSTQRKHSVSSVIKSCSTEGTRSKTTPTLMSNSSSESEYSTSSNVSSVHSGEQLEDDTMLKSQESFENESSYSGPTSDHEEDLSLKIMKPIPVGDSPKMHTWNFDPFVFTEDQLESLIFDIFQSFELLKEFSISEPVFKRYIFLVRSKYTQTSYHNFRHAFDVLQTCYSFLCSSKVLLTVLEKIDIFALLLSALCHDVGHEGLNNVYQVNAQTKLALIYNDQSVLECMHASSAFVIALENEDANIFKSFSKDLYQSIRKRIIQCIMGTDMSFHFELLSKFKAHALVGHSFLVESDEDVELLLRMVLHSADIANPTKPWESAYRWADLLLQEFFLQGDKEKAEDLPISPLMDRSKIKLARMSANFIDFVVEPLFETLLLVFPELQTTAFANMKSNRKRWNELCEQLTLLDLVTEVDVQPEKEDDDHEGDEQSISEKESVVPPSSVEDLPSKQVAAASSHSKKASHKTMDQVKVQNPKEAEDRVKIRLPPLTKTSKKSLENAKSKSERRPLSARESASTREKPVVPLRQTSAEEMVVGNEVIADVASNQVDVRRNSLKSRSLEVSDGASSATEVLCEGDPQKAEFGFGLTQSKTA